MARVHWSPAYDEGWGSATKVAAVSAPTLVTPRLTLEPWSEHHTELAQTLASIPGVMRYIGDGRPWPAQRARELAAANREHWRRHGFGWRVGVDRETGHAVGFYALNFAGPGAGVDAAEYEIGWWLEPASWGRGLAREGAAAVRDEAFERLGAPSLLARIQPANGPSLAVARAIGLREDSRSYGRAGEPIDVLRLGAQRWRDLSRARTLPVEIAGRHVEAIELGGDETRPAIVLLHEGLGSVGLWREFPQLLQRATGRRVIAFSRFGHGRSQTSPWEADVTGFHHREAQTMLPELLEQVGAPQPLLVGHSDGASIALIHAARHPVARLVLLAPHVFVEPLTIASIRQTRDSYQQGELRERMSRHHDDVDAAFWGWCAMWLDPEFERWNLEADAAGVSAPTLLIQGADDPYGTLEQIDRVEAALAGPVRRCVVPGGHSPHLEAPDAVIRAIAGFISATL